MLKVKTLCALIKENLKSAPVDMLPLASAIDTVCQEIAIDMGMSSGVTTKYVREITADIWLDCRRCPSFEDVFIESSDNAADIYPDELMHWLSTVPKPENYMDQVFKELPGYASEGYDFYKHIRDAQILQARSVFDENGPAVVLLLALNTLQETRKYFSVSEIKSVLSQPEIFETAEFPYEVVDYLMEVLPARMEEIHDAAN